MSGRLWLLFVLSLLLAMPMTLLAADTIKPFVSYGYFYDDNIFRLDRDETIVISDNGRLQNAPQRSDRYGVLSAGLNVDWRIGRQRVLANLARSQVKFDQYKFLDYNGQDYMAAWQWRLGNELGGKIGASKKVSQTSFADFTGGAAVNNRAERETAFASADWQIFSSWSAGIEGVRTRTVNSAPLYVTENYIDSTLTAWLGYATPKGSRVRGQVRKIRARYPNRVVLPGALADSSFEQSEIAFLGDWASSGKLTSHVSMAYVARDHDSVEQRDFSGISARTWVDYSSSSKMTLSAALYRELGSSELEHARYFLNSGLSLGANWKLTDKLMLNASARAERRDYKGDPAPVTGAIARRDDIAGGSLTLTYNPIPALTLDIGMQAGRRDSNQPGGDYAFHQISTSMRIAF